MDTADSQENIAACADDPGEAAGLLREVYQTRLDVLGAGHPARCGR